MFPGCRKNVCNYRGVNYASNIKGFNTKSVFYKLYRNAITANRTGLIWSFIMRKKKNTVSLYRLKSESAGLTKIILEVTLP